MKTCILLLFFLATFISCNTKSGEHNHATSNMDHAHETDSSKMVLYWCPMDTQVVQKIPGTCPICAMDLEPKPMAHNHDSLVQKDWVYTPANVFILSSIHSIHPVKKTISIQVDVTGYIDYDESRFYDIPAKIGGRIEKLYVKYNYQPVEKGHPLFEIYSRDLQTAQQEYLYIKESDPDNSELIKAAKTKLMLLGMTSGQISKLNAGQSVSALTTIYSNHTGFVLERKKKKELLPSTSGESMSMESAGADVENANIEFTIREGSYVDRGQAVFTVANTDVVWAIFEIIPGQLNLVKINQPVHITMEGSEEMVMGKINFIEPAYKEGTGTAKIRVYLNNKNQNYKIGALLSGKIEAGKKEGLWIPQSSVYNLGKDNIVFIKRDGAFETKLIKTGYSSGKEVEVVSGLTEGDEVAENAQFMVDSESFIKVKK